MFDFNSEKLNIKNSLIVCGVELSQAEIVADCFATADLYGVDSHGINVLPSHIERIKNGGYNLTPNFKTVRETSAFAVIDGDNALGPVSATYSTNYAIEKCKESGMFTVFSRNNNTFGPAFYYPLLASQKGYIGITYSNSPAQMAPIGGKDKMLGTNPFSIVIPNKDKPIIIDMATSVVAKSKFKQYKEKGLDLPLGWALDENGKPTTNPDEAIKGLVLPMAGFKGYGIALAIDILAGLLSGSACLDEVGRFYNTDKCMNVGFTFTVIDPIKVLGEDWNDKIDVYVSKLRNSQAIDGQSIILPGDDRLEKKNEKEGK